MSRKDILNGSKILVTGGTGSFGNEIIQKLLDECDLQQITIFSRDEKKQYDMRNFYGNNPKLRFVIGDVRNRDSVFQVMRGQDYVFHAAALKQVPSCEFFPWEAVQTNISGANNVLDAAEQSGVKKVVVLSTDKAVYPINAMGISKAMMEKLMLAKARLSTSGTVFCGVRYGNVMYSRGSVFPLFVEQIRSGKPLTITHPDMTRYLLPLPVAIELVLFALENGTNGDLLVRKAPAATVRDMAEATARIFNYSKGIKNIGIREGEKMHETLVTREELMKAEEYENYYRIHNLGEINYSKYFSEGDSHPVPTEDYTSENAKRLSLDETEAMIRDLKEIKAELG
ncbi:MAG: polysaccharide biosynthesis protein [Bacteroidales bacterium]